MCATHGSNGPICAKFHLIPSILRGRNQNKKKFMNNRKKERNRRECTFVLRQDTNRLFHNNTILSVMNMSYKVCYTFDCGYDQPLVGSNII